MPEDEKEKKVDEPTSVSEAEAEAAAQEAAEAAVAADAQQVAQIASGNTEQAKSKGSNESFVVEIRQQDSTPARKSNKTLH